MAKFEGNIIILQSVIIILSWSREYSTVLEELESFFPFEQLSIDALEAHAFLIL